MAVPDTSVSEDVLNHIGKQFSLIPEDGFKVHNGGLFVAILLHLKITKPILIHLDPCVACVWYIDIIFPLVDGH